MLSDNWLSRYRLLENLKKCDGNGNRNGNGNSNGNGNGNAYDRGDYNSSFALRAVELKSCFSHNGAHMFSLLQALRFKLNCFHVQHY